MGYTIKPLVWIKRDHWVAETPSLHTGYMTICFEQGKFWANWDMTLPGTTDLDALKHAGQVWHNNWLSQFVELTPEPWEDRMGGQFTQEEIARAERGGDGW